MAKPDEELPPEVQAEVDKIRESEGEVQDEPAEEPARAAVPPEKPLSRRQIAEQERLAQIQAANERAASAETLAKQLRDDREKDIERFARMEALLEERFRPREEAPRTETPTEDDGAKIAKLRRQATEALAAGKLDEYHDLSDQITDIRAEARARAIVSKLPRQEAPPPPKPAWVSAVESQFPDVLTHADGLNHVAAFAQIDKTPFGPEKLKRAFERARTELGTGKKKETPGEVTQRREMLSGGPVNGGNGGGNGKGGKFVNVPPNYKEIARRAGMTPEQYVKAYASMNPSEVTAE